MRVRNNQRLRQTPLRLRSSEPSSVERAWLYALRLLAARDYSSAKLREKLGSREFEAAHIDIVVLRLESENWVNDRRFAERFADSATASGRFYGPRLKMELKRRGVPSGIVDDVMAGLSASCDVQAELRQIIERCFPGFCYGTATDKEKRRLMGFLQRRGFGFSDVIQAMKEVDKNIID